MEMEERGNEDRKGKKRTSKQTVAFLEVPFFSFFFFHDEYKFRFIPFLFALLLNMETK